MEHLANRQNIGNNEEVIGNVCELDVVRKCKYFGDEGISKEEVKLEVRKYEISRCLLNCW